MIMFYLFIYLYIRDGTWKDDSTGCKLRGEKLLKLFTLAVMNVGCHFLIYFLGILTLSGSIHIV